MRAAVVRDLSQPPRPEDVPKPDPGDGEPSRKPEGVLTEETEEHPGPVPG